MKSYIKIGRDKTNDVVINEPRVSRQHAVVTVLDDGRFEIKDLDSSNGTYVNGKKISSQIISPGDKIKVAASIVDWESAFRPSSASQETISNEEPFAAIKKTISTGTANDNDLILTGEFVSAYHATISRLKKGTYYLQDLDSRNGSFVNGNKIKAKNFSQTDLVRLATAELPQDWFLHKKLQPHFFRDNRKKILFTALFTGLVALGVVGYINRCSWFGIGCTLTANELYTANKNTMVQIEHGYYYTFEANGKKYFVGRNKQFGVTEANTSKENLLPYNTASGSGFFIREDGTIATSPLVLHPWLFSGEEKNKMRQEVKASKTFSQIDVVALCGETAELKFLPNGIVNHTNNYISAKPLKECEVNEHKLATLQSVAQSLPSGASVVNYNTAEGPVVLNKTPNYYYSSFFQSQPNTALRDTFYAASDSFDINRLSFAALNTALPPLPEGSAVLNERGELVGIIQQGQIVFIHYFKHQ